MTFQINRAGHFWDFLIYSIIKNDFFAFFIKLTLLGVDFLNWTSAEISFSFDIKAIKSFFIIEKIQKYRKCPALQINCSNFVDLHGKCARLAADS